MDFKNDEKPRNPLEMTREELKLLRSGLIDKMFATPPDAKTADERLKLKRDLVNKFVEQQIEAKERYAHIFKTDRGSIYFMLKTGEALRIKTGGNELDIVQPLMEKSFFVDDSEANKLLGRMADPSFQQEIIGLSIPTTNVKIGAAPIEFGMDESPRIKFKEESGNLTILGDRDGLFVSGFHIGHRISEIIK